MTDRPPDRLSILTPLGPFDAYIEPEATVADLIEYVVANKPLHRGDLFELIVDGVVIDPALGLDRLPKGKTEVIATGRAI